MSRVFFFNDTATTEIYTLSLHDALPISARSIRAVQPPLIVFDPSSQDTVLFRKYDSFAMWQASAALWPNTTSSTTGFRVRTASKNVHRCGLTSSKSGPLKEIVSGIAVA